ncbi:MAG: hypothetical protein LBF86_00025 [Helicobacteraceae bacterium]|jgi:hypothetical protein|nr:hypothetical protein [Helicobacteraceae bacterium]
MFFYEGVFFSETLEGVTYREAETYCKNYPSVIPWRLPNRYEMVKLGDSYEFLPDKREKSYWTKTKDDDYYYKKDGGIVYYDAISVSTINYSKVRIWRPVDWREQDDWFDRTARYNAICAVSPSDVNKVRAAPTRLMAEMAKKDLAGICAAEAKPVKTEATIPPKGEFEITADYDKKVKSLLDDAEKGYQDALAAWRERDAKRKRDCRQTRENLKKNQSVIMGYYSDVFHFLYGAPMLDKVEYNADKQEFSVIFRAQIDQNFTLPMRVPVKMSYAQDFKRILQANAKDIELEIRADGDKFTAVPPRTLLKPEQFVEGYLLKEASNIDEVKAFIESYPQSIHRAEAEKKYCDLTKTIAEVKAFIDLYPQSIHRAEAEKKYCDLAKTIDEVRAFIELYPQSIHRAEAEKKYYELAKTIAEMKAFIELCPQSVHRDKAEKKYYDLARTSIAALNDFIAAVPKSALIPAAQEDLAQLKADEKAYRARLEAQAKEEARLKEEWEKEQAERERRKNEAYMARKSIGELVCRDTTLLFGALFPCQAFVEDISGDKIQIRIHNSGGTSYDKGQILWDNYYNWRRCSY